MNSFHVNLGHVFAQPYESEYAMLRRCLVANPGVPLSAIESNLRYLMPQEGSILGRLHALQLSPDLVPFHGYPYPEKSYQRQCPQCAQQLYHSDIYALPWLSRCPIHHCALTRHCPVCQKPWPDNEEMARRDCSVCGKLPIKKIKKIVLLNIKNQNYQPIANIYKLIDCKGKVTSLGINGRNDFDRESRVWWRKVPISSSRFPSFQACRHSGFSNKKLKTLNIPIYKIHRKTTKILPAPDLEDKMWEKSHPPSWHDEVSKDITKTSSKRLNADFNVMEVIVSWIMRHTPKKHRIHITSYRYLNMRYFINAPDPCPYCLAFSLWFLHISAIHYGNHTTEIIDDYDFCEDAGFNYFLNSHEPLLRINGGYYNVSSAFSTWFYRRGLEISFLDTLRFAFDLLRQLDLYRKSVKYSYPIPYQDRVFADQYYCVDIDDGRLLFYYENDHPLGAFSPGKITKLDALCRNYQQYHAKHKFDRNEIIMSTLTGVDLQYCDFLSLHEKFREYLGDLFWS